MFDSGTANIRASDGNKIAEIATYLASNPSLQLDIDGTTDPLNPSLSGARVNTVHAALIQAGVQDSVMRHGSVNDPQLRQDGRVEILLSTR
jgi:outer membrane protein OmpA-like peptidoglycan-associated protein